MTMRSWLTSFFAVVVPLAVALGVSIPASAGLIVNDTWKDGNRTDPATAAVGGPYSENGTDTDADGDLESVWFVTPAASTAVTPNHLTFTQQTGSSSYTTYFTPEASQITIPQGQTLKVTWVFTPTGVGTDTGRGLRMALVDTAGANRLIANGSPGNSTFTGYRLGVNVSQTLIAASLRLQERFQLASDNLLTNDDRWGADGVQSAVLSDVGAAGQPGFVNGTEYTLVWALTRTLSDQMQVNVSIAGTNFAGTGSLGLSYLDATPNAGSFTFDTLGMRPSSAAATAGTFDTTLFRVELVVPEPASLVLLGMAGLGLCLSTRRRS
jgi:hypothetical protein